MMRMVSGQTGFLMIIFLPLLLPCSSAASIWEQIQEPAGASNSSPGQTTAGVSGGFWGSLLGHRPQQGGGGEHNTFRNSQRKIESKRQILPSSLRSLHTLNTEYEDDYGEMFTPEESRTLPHQ